MNPQSPAPDDEKPIGVPRWPLPGQLSSTPTDIARRAQVGLQNVLQQLGTLPLWGRIGMGRVALFSTCVVCSACMTGIAANSSSSTSAQRTPTSARTVAVAATSTATLAPTATQNPTPTSTTEAQLDVSITCAEGTDYSYAKVCVHTASGATVSISVTYCSGQPPKSKLPDRTTDAKGNASWQWTPQTSCRGNTDVFIYAYKGDLSGSASTSFTLH